MEESLNTMNNACSAYCIHLIRAVMQETDVPEKPEHISLQELYAFAKLHNVEALIYHGLCQTNVDISDPVWRKWENRAAMLLAQGVVQLAERDAVFSALTSAGIPLLPFKGCWLKELYPNMEYRQMADLDMLIPPEKAAEAKRIMLSMGYQTEEFENMPNHAGYLKPPYTEVELHTALLVEDRGYYDRVWELVHPVENCPGLYRFSAEDEYIYYLLHLNKHLEDAGTGIRSVLDSLVYRQAYPNMDRAYLRQELEKWGLWERIQEIECLSDCWFVTGKEVPEELEGLAQHILTAGAFGTVEIRSERRLKKLREKYKDPVIRGIVYWIIRTCRPMEEMVQCYPVLKKLPVLLPFFWFHRAVMKFAKSPKAVWHHIKLAFGKGENHG